MESQNNGGSFANGDSISNDSVSVGVCRDQAWDLRGLGLKLFPDKYAHVPNGG